MILGTVTTILDVIVGLFVLYFAIRYLGRFLQWIERSEIARQKAEAEAERKKKAAAAPAPAAAAPEPAGVPADHVAAISAAVAAIGARIVHIEDATTDNAWAAEGRWMHQMSHRPH